MPLSAVSLSSFPISVSLSSSMSSPYHHISAKMPQMLSPFVVLSLFAYTLTSFASVEVSLPLLDYSPSTISSAAMSSLLCSYPSLSADDNHHTLPPTLLQTCCSLYYMYSSYPLFLFLLKIA